MVVNCTHGQVGWHVLFARRIVDRQNLCIFVGQGEIFLATAYECALLLLGSLLLFRKAGRKDYVGQIGVHVLLLITVP